MWGAGYHGTQYEVHTPYFVLAIMSNPVSFALCRGLLSKHGLGCLSDTVLCIGVAMTLPTTDFAGNRRVIGVHDLTVSATVGACLLKFVLSTHPRMRGTTKLKSPLPEVCTFLRVEPGCASLKVQATSECEAGLCVTERNRHV
jgi:hypothetical protein